jgi:pyruvate dehydrogenase E1 component beta subunit
VYVLEHKGLYNIKEDVPDDTGPMALGKALVRREGSDVTVVATQLMMHRSLEAAEKLADEGIDVEVIDLRSMVPMDEETLLTSMAKTNRLVVVEEAPHSAGWGGDIVSLAADQGIYWLDAPVKRVNMGETLIPYSPPLEDGSLPNVGRIMAAIQEVMAE